jgi:serine/threonine-protein kinase
MSTNEKLSPGMVLGRYELLLPIAQGGMATVWAARQRGSRGFQKTVAIKTMLPTLSEDPQFEQMFLDEAALAAKIHHPHVCEILDLGEQDGLLYLVMEWIDGEPLSALARATRQRGQSVPLSVALRMCLSAALGLHAAHELKDENGNLVGLVHRDVSPQNILVTYDGVVKIVDFGVAKATAEADGGRTKDGQLKGKVPFMSPEQALGKAVDRRTDVFAMGIVMYQLLANKHPFRGDNDMITLRRICDKEPAPPLADNFPGCPRVVHELVMKALEKDPERRFQTMAELARTLDRAIAELKVEGQPDEDLPAFVRSVLGDRAEKRRASIREALKVADERAEQREQEKAQRAALLAQARAMKTVPPGLQSSQGGLAVPPGFSLPPASIPPPAPSRPSQPFLPPPSMATGVTLATSPTAIVADVGGMGAPGSGKKKLAVVAFAALGAAALGAAIFVFTQGSGSSDAATQPPGATSAAATTQAVAPPAPTQAPAPSTVPAASSASAKPAESTSAKKGSGSGAKSTAPTTKTTGGTKTNTSSGLPQVRDPGF